MNITLRKAAALQNAIQETLRGIEVKLTVQINEFEDPAAVLDRANADALANDQRRESLLKALYTIRSQVGQTNAVVGISERLAQAAFVDKRIGTLNAFLQQDAVQDSMAVITGKVDKLKNDKGDGRRSLYGYNDYFGTGVLVPEQVERFKAEQLSLKKQKQKINDEILELNVRTEISLDEVTLAVLTQEGIL